MIYLRKEVVSPDLGRLKSKVNDGLFCIAFCRRLAWQFSLVSLGGLLPLFPLVSPHLFAFDAAALVFPACLSLTNAKDHLKLESRAGPGLSAIMPQWCRHTPIRAFTACTVNCHLYLICICYLLLFGDTKQIHSLLIPLGNYKIYANSHLIKWVTYWLKNQIKSQ